MGCACCTTIKRVCQPPSITTGNHQGPRRAAPLTLCTGAIPMHHTASLCTCNQESKLQQRRATKHRPHHPVHSFLEDFQPSATAAALLGQSTPSAAPDYRVVLQEIYNLLDHDQSPASNSDRGRDELQQGDATPRHDDRVEAVETQQDTQQREEKTVGTQTADDGLACDALWDAVTALQCEVQSLHSAHMQLQHAMQQHEGRVGHVLTVVQSQLGQLLATTQAAGWNAWGNNSVVGASGVRPQ